MMNQEQPLVSVLTTVYNRERFIADAIGSVLSSFYRNLELIIVDDCSSDKSVEIAKKFAQNDDRVKVYVNDKNLGDYPNRNKAASYAKGRYIKYLDSDDIMYSHCLQVMVSAMEQFPDAGYGLSCLGDPAHPYPVAITQHAAYMEHFSGLGHFNRAPGSAIIRKAAFDAVGGFSGERMIGDYELWLKLGRYYPLVKLPVDLYWSRIHSGQESKTDYANEYKLLREKVMQEAFAHKDCPLSEAEIKSITQKMKKKSFKSNLLNLFR